MKHLSLILLIMSLSLCSCNNNDEPESVIGLPIAGTFVPSSMELHIDQISDEQKRNIFHLVNNEHIVNNISEFPEDPIGFSGTFKEIDFNEYTLLIKYDLHDYTIDTYSNRYFRNTKENTYNWSINIGTSSDTDVVDDDLWLTRFAIFVKKLPADATVKTWFGLTSVGSHSKTSE